MNYANKIKKTIGSVIQKLPPKKFYWTMEGFVLLEGSKFSTQTLIFKIYLLRELSRLLAFDISVFYLDLKKAFDTSQKYFFLLYFITFNKDILFRDLY